MEYSRTANIILLLFSKRHKNINGMAINIFEQKHVISALIMIVYCFGKCPGTFGLKLTNIKYLL